MHLRMEFDSGVSSTCLKTLCYSMQAEMRKKTTEETLNNGRIQFIQLEEDFSKLTMRVS